MAWSFAPILALRFHDQVLSDQLEHVVPGRRVKATLSELLRLVNEARISQGNDGGQVQSVHVGVLAGADGEDRFAHRRRLRLWV